MILRSLWRDHLLLLAASLVLVAAAATIWSARALTPAPAPAPAAAAYTLAGWASGTANPEPEGEWVTSSWPTTRYYTTRADTATWREWAADNRVWFATEAELLAVFQGRERKGR